MTIIDAVRDEFAPEHVRVYVRWDDYYDEDPFVTVGLSSTYVPDRLKMIGLIRVLRDRLAEREIDHLIPIVSYTTDDHEADTDREVA